MVGVTKEPNPLTKCSRGVYAMNYFLDKLDPIAKVLLSPGVKKRMEKGFVSFALLAFLVHLALYILNKYVAFDLPSTLFSSPLQILYTPFSVVLVAEIYLLVYYLPSSFGRSMGKQIEIIALIEIRTVFKDLDNTSTWPWEAAFFPHILSALLLGGILVIFYRVLPQQVARMEEDDLQHFVRFKRVLAAALMLFLLALSAYALSLWGYDIVIHPDHLRMDPNTVFYTEFFTTLILVDVLILVVSLRYLHDFGQVIRNSGFIVATVMLRRALGIEPWHAFAYEVNAAVLAVLMVLLQRYLPRRSKS